MSDAVQTLLLYAPVSGKTINIDQVPDDVFAQKMVGDGIAVLTESHVLIAPTDGVISNIHSSHHALTMRTTSEVEVLMHIGLETVRLNGQGFTLHVAAGQTVKKGDSLITFDLDFIQKNAKSPMTVIVITNPEKVSQIKPFEGRNVVASKDVVMEVVLSQELADDAACSLNLSGHTAESWGIPVINPSGMHARPAAHLAAEAKKFRSDVFLIKGEAVANAKSLVDIMGLDLKKGDVVRLKAVGFDAIPALRQLIPFLQKGAGETIDAPSESASSSSQQGEGLGEKEVKNTPQNVFTGIPASEGVAVGKTVRLKKQKVSVVESANNPAQEQKKFAGAVAQTQMRLQALRDETAQKAGAEKADIFAAHEELLEDPVFMRDIGILIGKGKTAAFAVVRVIEDQIKKFEALKNPVLAGRANDLHDVEMRLLAALGVVSDEKKVFPENTVLLAEEISASDAVSLSKGTVVGFASVRGGATSHAAILARALSVPAMAGVSPEILDVPDGTPCILDGTRGRLELNPDVQMMDGVRVQEEEQRAVRQKQKDAALLPSVTTDGVKVEVAGNIAGKDETDALIADGGAGVGLLRSEFLFSGRTTPPDEDEQAAVYSEIAEKLGKKRFMIVRTLDAGGDKPLPYLKMPVEDNPFLGVRGIRLSLANPSVFRTQLRAILRASNKTNVKIMFPMVSSPEEFLAAKEMLAEEADALSLPADAAGMMVEVPSAVMLADVFAQKVDFFSIGTNDLSQYTLAADRGNAAVSGLADAFHPAVFRMIKTTLDAAKTNGKEAGVCGNLAGDAPAVPVLVGLGARELSVAVPLIPKIKATVRLLNVKECEALAQEVLSAPTAAVVREKAVAFYQHLTTKE